MTGHQAVSLHRDCVLVWLKNVPYFFGGEGGISLYEEFGTLYILLEDEQLE